MGPSKLEDIGTSLGKAIRGFKKGVSGEGEDDADKKDTKN